MKRVQLFEFEDFSWFPSWLRICMTKLIVLLQRMLGVKEVLAELVAKAVEESEVKQVVDLGAGAGGVMPEVIQLVKSDYGYEQLELLMTDLYPDPGIVQKFNEPPRQGLRYYPNSVDATDFSTVPEGLKTMVNSFHHMKPEGAKKILSTAIANKQPLLIYEMGENKLPLLVWWLLLPVSLLILMIMVLFMTPFVRPLTWQQLVFTYILPIIPICYAWDGQASLPRMYTFKDIDHLLEGLKTDNYTWRKERAVKKKNNKPLGTYLMGIPK